MEVMRKWMLLGSALLLAFSGAHVLAQSADASGDWQGRLNGGAQQLRIALHLGTTSTFDSPDQGAIGMPAQLSVVEGKVTVQLRGAGVFQGALSADGRQLQGTYRQNGAS